MKSRAFIIIFISIPVFFSSIYLFAQMPDWKFFRDREGNGYYYDRTFRIRITDEKPFDYAPVSEKSADYSLHKGIELVKNGRYIEGLYYLKSLKALPADNLRVEKNAKDATGWINYLQKKHGDRYDRFDKESTILLNFSGGKYSLINEKLRYKIVIKKQPLIVKALWKQSGNGYGLKFGFNLEKETAAGENIDQGYDCIVGIESRIFKGKIGSVGEASESWRYELGRDNFVREEILRRDDRAVYVYTFSDGVPFSGIEGIYINGNIIHILRVLCANEVREKVYNEIRKPVEELILVK